MVCLQASGKTTLRDLVFIPAGMAVQLIVCIGGALALFVPIPPGKGIIGCMGCMGLVLDWSWLVMRTSTVTTHDGGLPYLVIIFLAVTGFAYINHDMLGAW